MGDLSIAPIEEIIKKAISHIENPKDFSFSEYINQIEKKAHEIYLEEEKKAIKSKLLKKFNSNSVLKQILEELADLIQKLSVIIANTRRARAGVSSEYILREALLRYAGIESEVIGKMKGKNSYYPDIAIPSQKELIIALAVKRTLRERWREDISIFKYYPNSAFVCISEDTDVSEKKLKDMEIEGIKVLFLPDAVYEKHKEYIKNNIRKMKVYKLSDLPTWIRSILS